MPGSLLHPTIALLPHKTQRGEKGEVEDVEDADASGTYECCVTMVMPFLLNDVQGVNHSQRDPELLLGV